MQKIVVSIFIFIIAVCSLHAQLLPMHYIRKNLRIHTDTSIIDMVIIEDDITIKAKSDLTYYWYKNRKIFTNQGGIGGNVLDGPYTCYTKNDQLLEQGRFKMGLKEGVWKQWYINGDLKQQRRYKNGQLHGKSICYKSDGTAQVLYYKHNEKRESDLHWLKREKNNSQMGDTLPQHKRMRKTIPDDTLPENKKFINKQDIKKSVNPEKNMKMPGM